MANIRIAQGGVFPLEQVLAGIAHLDTRDLEDFQKEISLLLARRRGLSLQARESMLLEKINNRVVPEIWQRYEILHAKLQGEMISEEERQELLSLTEQMENINAEWLRYVLELAQLQIAFGLHPPLVSG